MAYLETDNGRERTRIHYSITGEANLPVLVLSHSLGVSLAMWKPQTQALASTFRLLSYDTRGHGDSSVPAGPYSIADLARDVLALMDHQGIAQASFGGLSMGGVVGQWLGIHAPHRLNRLILASTAAKIGSAETWNSRIDIVERQGLDPIIPGTLDRWFTPAFHAADPHTLAETQALLAKTSPLGYAACCAAIRDADFRTDVQGITVPTLVISGTSDPVTPPADGRYLADSIPGAHYIELPGAHLCSVESSTAFNASLLSFLTC